MPNWIRIGGETVRPWTVLVTSRSNDLVLAHEMIGGTALGGARCGTRWSRRCSTRRQGNRTGPPRFRCRPTNAGNRCGRTSRRSASVWSSTEELDQLDGVFQEMCEHVCGKPKPGLLDMPGVTPEQVGGFYEAAAAFLPASPVEEGRLRGGDQGRVRQVPERPLVCRADGAVGLDDGSGPVRRPEGVAADVGRRPGRRGERPADAWPRASPSARSGTSPWPTWRRRRSTAGRWPVPMPTRGLPQGPGAVDASAAGLGTGTDGGACGRSRTS